MSELSHGQVGQEFEPVTGKHNTLGPIATRPELVEVVGTPQVEVPAPSEAQVSWVTPRGAEYVRVAGEIDDESFVGPPVMPNDGKNYVQASRAPAPGKEGAHANPYEYR